VRTEASAALAVVLQDVVVYKIKAESRRFARNRKFAFILASPLGCLPLGFLIALEQNVRVDNREQRCTHDRHKKEPEGVSGEESAKQG
jgi:hypothetical protein